MGGRRDGPVGGEPIAGGGRGVTRGASGRDRVPPVATTKEAA